jgi:predicted nucleotidyltransferase
METTYDPKPLTTEQLQALSQDVKQVLTELYGDRLDRVVLFGSYARGDFHNESDIDYLVVLRDETVNGAGEIWYMVDKYNALISVKPASLSKYQQSPLPFTRTFGGKDT